MSNTVATPQERPIQRQRGLRGLPGSGAALGSSSVRQSARKATVMMTPLTDVGLPGGGGGGCGGGRDVDFGGPIDDYDALRRRFADVDERRAKEYDNYQRSQRTASANEQANPFVFLDFTVADVPIGRVIVELFEDVVPLTVANFRALCCGERGFDAVTGQKLDYVDTCCSRIIKDQGASFGGFSGLSISADSGTFNDEKFKYMHGERGVLSMVSRGPNTNGSAFHVTFGAVPSLDYKQVVFGRVDEGLQFLDRIEAVGADRCGVPRQMITINFCGVVRGERPQPPPFPSLDEYERLLSSAAPTPAVGGVASSLQQCFQRESVSSSAPAAGGGAASGIAGGRRWSGANATGDASPGHTAAEERAPGGYGGMGVSSGD